MLLMLFVDSFPRLSPCNVNFLELKSLALSVRTGTCHLRFLAVSGALLSLILKFDWFTCQMS